MAAINIPDELEMTRKAALRAIQPIRPVDDKTKADSHFLLKAQETKAGASLPQYYLVYFLLVDLLGFKSLGRSEKIAWSIPIDFQGKAFLIEYRKFGLGIFFAHDAINEEQQAQQIVHLIAKGVRKAEPFYDWLAQEAANKSELNVPNRSYSLFSRFNYFLGLYKEMDEESKEDTCNKDRTLEVIVNAYNHSSKSKRNARWLALAAIEAFFSWTEHVFIHLAIFLGKSVSGKEVAGLTEADWPDKFKKVFDLNETGIKLLYDELTLIRRQLRNYVAHGAFGKNGESFYFHSGSGAVPILLPHKVNGPRFALSDALAFEDADAIKVLERFMRFLWAEEREPARLYIQESGLPAILTMAQDGTYGKAMRSIKDMEELVTYLSYEADQASNMDY